MPERQNSVHLKNSKIQESDQRLEEGRESAPQFGVAFFWKNGMYYTLQLRLGQVF